MADGHITVEFRLPLETEESVRLIAKTAGVSVATVVKIALAMQVLKSRALPAVEIKP